MHLTPSRAALAALPLVFALVAPKRAEACGGFFCSTGPVDQSSERILFEVHEDGSTTATVEVRYNGDPGDFSWVVPVPEVPTVTVVPSMVLDILDVWARPTIVPRPVSWERCSGGSFFPGFGCYEAMAPTAPSGGGAPVSGGAPPVDVVDLPRVGPYDDIVVVSSDDPRELIGWLNGNGYIITPAMEPLVEEYVAEGKKFLALKLAPDAGVQDISPIQFTCPSESPTIPIRLTAVAAEPGMRIVVHVAADQRYRPMNFREITIDEDQLHTDPWGFRDNYDALVAMRVDEEGGKAFVAERAGPSADIRASIAGVSPSNEEEAEAQRYLVDLLERRPYLTRLYTRMSASDMTDDPIFLPAGTGDEVSGVYDLSDLPAIDACAPDAEAGPLCGFSYCGRGARCAVDEDGNEGCLCDDDAVARLVLAPTRVSSMPTVTCQDPDEDRLGDVEGIGNPCDGYNCGEGATCVAVNGFPTCACPDGRAAFVDLEGRPGGELACRPAALTFGRERLVSPPEPGSAANAVSGAVMGAGCASAQARFPVVELATLFAVLALLGIGRARRQ